ncbi:Uncharacterised protein at_DN0646, partial [Pycnogonum litorale]
QHVVFYIDRGVLGLSKELTHSVLEYSGDPVPSGTRSKFDSQTSLVVPVMPPTLINNVCRLLQIYYVLKICLRSEKSGDDLHMNFPLTIATCPFRIPNSNNQPGIHYDVARDHVEGGMYIGPEFQLGQVYDGTLGMEEGETVVLYRPVYVCISPANKRHDINSHSKQLSKTNNQLNKASSSTSSLHQIKRQNRTSSKPEVETLGVGSNA